LVLDGGADVIVFYCDSCGEVIHRTVPGAVVSDPKNTVTLQSGPFHFCDECRKSGLEMLAESGYAWPSIGYVIDRIASRMEH
jgi:hypothetical protein